jgi:signal transduction histidine kinase
MLETMSDLRSGLTTMLYEFLTTNHAELVSRCRAKVAKRAAPRATTKELEYGIPLFLTQLVNMLRSESGAEQQRANFDLSAEIGSSAGKHGNELLREGFTVDQVVHDYGDLCQAVTELAHEQQANITVEEFRTFNRCLDNAIADAVTEFGRQRDQNISEEGAQSMNERLGSLAHELRNLLNSATLAFQAMQSGNVAPNGATGTVLGRSLTGLRDLVDRSLAEVRLTEGLQVKRERIVVSDLVYEVQVAAAMDARERGVAFTVPGVDNTLAVDADRQMLSSAMANLLQNAFKFTRHNSHVSLTAQLVEGRVTIEIEDECGGLPQGKPEALFLPFRQGSADRTGLGLGLSISRRAIEAIGGKLSVRNLPGKGCVFKIDLPLARAS